MLSKTSTLSLHATLRQLAMQSLAIFHKRTLVLTAAAAAATLILGYCVASGQETLDTFHFSQQASHGRKLAPVPLNLQGKNPDLVYLGSYIVNGQAGCNQCHTCPSYRGIDPYKVGGQSLGKTNPINTLNFMAGGTPFQNSTIISPNLTPDNSGLPGGMNYDDFSNAMRNG